MMSDETRETIDSPLDAVLRSLPEETPPKDLQSRILDATSKQKGKILRTRRPFRGWLPELLAAAAVVALILASQIPRAYMRGTPGPETVSMAPAATAAPAAKTGARAGAAKAAEPAAGSVPARSPYDRAEGAVAEEAVPMAKSGADYRDTAKDYSDVAASDRLFATQPEAERNALRRGEAFATKSAPAVPPGDSAGYMGSTGPRLPEDFKAPEKPWRDESGTRQQITSKTLEMEVRNVEDAFDRSKSIIQKAHGIVESEDLEVRHRQPSRAHLRARLPLDQIDGVVAQLRQLGKVLKLSGEAMDVSRQYYGQGEQLRDMGQRETELVDKYLKETNPQRKQQLYNQIMSIRESYKQPKSAMQDLSEQTHSVLLDLILTGRSGAAEFLPKSGELTGHAALWLLVTAVYWAPAAFVVWVVWRRVRLPGREG